MSVSLRLAPRLQLVADEQDRDDLYRADELYGSTPGFSARWLQRDELLRLQPGLSPAITAGLLTEGNARVDAGGYTRALARAAAALGARVVRAAARGLRDRAGRVTAVVLDTGSVSCDSVVVASGPWCAEPAAWLGASIPVEPVKGELLLVDPGVDVGSTDIAWRDTALYTTAGREVWLGSSEEHAAFDRSPSASARASILERAVHVLPALRAVPVVRQTVGLRPVTPDGLPILGAPGGWENICLALGGGRKGMLLGPAMGRAAAELVVNGSTQLPIDACSPEREALRPRAEVTAC
jgi:glycine/D-amino acid oxidase-like deaminating enzyme